MKSIIYIRTVINIHSTSVLYQKAARAASKAALSFEWFGFGNIRRSDFRVLMWFFSVYFERLKSQIFDSVNKFLSVKYRGWKRQIRPQQKIRELHKKVWWCSQPYYLYYQIVGEKYQTSDL